MIAGSRHLLLVNFTSFYSLPMLRAARERSIRVTIAGPDDAFGRFQEVAVQADDRIVASLEPDKRQSVLERLAFAHRADPFSGVFVSREDSVEAAAHIAAHLGLQWNSIEAMERMQNKWLTRQTLARAGLHQPPHLRCDSEAELTTLLSDSA